MNVLFKFNNKTLIVDDFSETDIPEVEELFSAQFPVREFEDYVRLLVECGMQEGYLNCSDFPAHMTIYLN